MNTDNILAEKLLKIKAIKLLSHGHPVGNLPFIATIARHSPILRYAHSSK